MSNPHGTWLALLLVCCLVWVMASSPLTARWFGRQHHCSCHDFASQEAKDMLRKLGMQWTYDTGHRLL